MAGIILWASGRVLKKKEKKKKGGGGGGEGTERGFISTSENVFVSR